MANVSPRYYSSGRYGTDPYSQRSTGSRFPVSPQNSPSEGDGRLMAEAFIKQYVRSLPIRSWLGKKIADAVLYEELMDKETNDLVLDIWKSLIALEERRTSLWVQTLFINDPASPLIKELAAVEGMLAQSEDIIVAAMGSIHAMNPAAIRSGKMNPKAIIRLVLVHSVMMSPHSTRWKALVGNASSIIETLVKRSDHKTRGNK